MIQPIFTQIIRNGDVICLSENPAERNPMHPKTFRYGIHIQILIAKFLLYEKFDLSRTRKSGRIFFSRNRDTG